MNMIFGISICESTRAQMLIQKIDGSGTSLVRPNKGNKLGLFEEFIFKVFIVIPSINFDLRICIHECKIYCMQL